MRVPLPASITSATPLAMIREVLASDERSHELSENELLTASEIAYQGKDFDTAARAMEGAVKRNPLAAQLHYRLGLCRSLAGAKTDAETSFHQALACDSALASAYQALIQIAIEQGETAAAVVYARAQGKACGSTPSLVLQTANLLLREDMPREALKLVHQLNAGPDVTAMSLRMEAELANRLDLKEQALDAARRTWLHDEGGPNAHFYAEILYRHNHYDEAAQVLQTALEQQSDNPSSHRLLSAALMQIGDFRGAMRAAISAVRLKPELAEYWHNAASLANALGFSQQAIEFAINALRLDEKSRALHVALANLLIKVGRFEEALEILDRAGAFHPEDVAIRDFRMSVLAQRAGYAAPAAVASTVAPLVRPLPRSQFAPRRPGPAPLSEALRVQYRVLSGLILRALSHRAIESRLGLVTLLFEPLTQILMVGVILSLFNGSRPPLGTHFFFFYATGLIPLYLFVHVVNHTMHVFIEHRALLQIPIVRRLDLVVSEAVAELLICGATGVLTFVGFSLIGWAPDSDNQMEAIQAYLALFLLAFGIGLIGAALNSMSRFYLKAWLVFQRSLYFISGVIFMAERMPNWVRDILVWNPILIAISWFRMGFFPQYSPPWISKSYVLLVGLACVVFGFVLERTLRRNVKVHP